MQTTVSPGPKTASPKTPSRARLRFFAALGPRPDAQTFLGASQQVTLIALAPALASFGLAFLLPRRARAHAFEGAERAAAPEPAGLIRSRRRFALHP